MVRFWASQGHTTEEREKFDRALEAPRQGSSPRKVTQNVIDEEMALFMQASQQMGG